VKRGAPAMTFGSHIKIASEPSFGACVVG
jgi:hypothetical protein